MPSFTFAYNETTSYYDVHAAGCAHLTMQGRGRHPNLQVCSTTEAASAKAAAADFESGNEGCFTKIKPCAKKAA